MDLTVSSVAKFEAEKELSEKVYMKVCALTSMYPPSEDFFTCFADDSSSFFIKPNQHGFFQIMHYLFSTLDSEEFNKRFYWPISDRRSESEFRTATVEYIKELKGKKQLQTSINPNYITVMPGGYKFLTFLDDLINFIVKKRIEAHEEELHEYGAIGDAEYEFDLRETIREFGISTQAIEMYEEELHKHTMKIEEQIDALKLELNILSSTVGISFEELTSQEFLVNFKNKVDQMQQTFIQKSAAIKSLNAPLVEYSNALENFEDSVEGIDSEKDKSVAAMIDHLSHHPDESILERELKLIGALGKRMLANSLIEVMNFTIPSIISRLSVNDDEDSNCNKIIHCELSKLEEQAAEIQKHLSECQDTLNQYVRSGVTKRQDILNESHDEDIESLLRMVSTPPIKLEPTERTFQSALRLPMIKMTDGGQTSTPSIKMKIKTPKTNVTIKSKIKFEDPIELLCGTPKGLKTPMSSSAFYENKSLLGLEISAKLSPETPKFVLQMETPPFDKEHTPLTPFAVNDCTQVPRRDPNLSIVKKVLNASVNVHDLSASPSGRLNALINATEVPKLKVNDLTLQSFDAIMLEAKNNENPVNDENDANALNFQTIDICSGIDEIAIADISDTILKDVTM